jgi:hypothetical protein
MQHLYYLLTYFRGILREHHAIQNLTFVLFSTTSLKYIQVGSENVRWEKCTVIRVGYLNKVQWKRPALF